MPPNKPQSPRRASGRSKSKASKASPRTAKPREKAVRAKPEHPNHDRQGRFLPGNTLGGPRPGSGRKRNELRELLRDALDTPCEVDDPAKPGSKVTVSALQLAVGTLYSTLLDPKTSVDERIKAAKVVFEYTVGRAPVSVEVEGSVNFAVMQLEQAAIREGVEFINGTAEPKPSKA